MGNVEINSYILIIVSIINNANIVHVNPFPSFMT